MKIVTWLYRNGLEYLVGALLFVIVVLAIVQVVYRYILEAPLSWTEEVARLLLVWAVCLGVATATKDNAHLKVDFIIQRGGRLSRLASALVADAVTALVAVGMIIYGWRFFAATANDYSTSLGYARNLYYLPVPIGGTLILLFVGLRAAAHLRGQEAEPSASLPGDHMQGGSGL